MGNQTNMQEKTALVTGGARGIGKAIACRFAREGCQVVICDILSAEAGAVVEKITNEVRDINNITKRRGVP